MKRLEAFYAPSGPERVGFVLKDGQIVEVENAAGDPLNAFDVRDEDLIRYEDEVFATFHTHPGGTSRLSNEDYVGFNMWPEWRHMIIGSDGVTAYIVTATGAIIVDEAADLPSWESEKAP